MKPFLVLVLVGLALSVGSILGVTYHHFAVEASEWELLEEEDPFADCSPYNANLWAVNQ